jgi:hypothetical protein
VSIAIPSETSSRLRENRSIACRNGFSSTTTSMNCAAPGAGPTTRMSGCPVSSMVSKDSTIADHTVSVRMSMSRSIAAGRVGAGEQPALLPHLDGDRAGADAGQDLPRQRIRHHAERRGIQHQGGSVGRREAVVQPVGPEIRDRRHVDHQQCDHH